MAAGNWESPFLTPKNKSLLALASFVMFKKAELYQRRFHAWLNPDYSGDDIEGFSLFKESSVFGFDSEYIRKLASLEDISGFHDTRAYIHSVFKVHYLKTQQSRSELASLQEKFESGDCLEQTGILFKQTATAITKVQNIMDGKFCLAFKHHHTLLQVLSDEEKLLKVHITDPKINQPFDWNKILLHTLNKTVGNYTYVRISFPQDDFQESP